MRSLLIGIVVFVVATVIVALNVRHNEKLASSLFVPFAREQTETAPAVAPESVATGADSVQSAVGGENAVLSALPIELIGTIVRLENSIATLRVLPGERENTAVHARIHDLATVTRIERERLFFTNASTGIEEYVRIMPFDPSKAVSREAMNAVGLTKEFNIRRADVDQQLSNLPQLLGSARAEPVGGASGHIIGFRIAAMDDSSYFKKLGLEPGDILSEVNGTKLESVEGVMKLFEELRNSSMIQLKAARGARDLQLTYLIR